MTGQRLWETPNDLLRQGLQTRSTPVLAVAVVLGLAVVEAGVAATDAVISNVLLSERFGAATLLYTSGFSVCFIVTSLGLVPVVAFLTPKGVPVHLTGAIAISRWFLPAAALWIASGIAAMLLLYSTGRVDISLGLGAGAGVAGGGLVGYLILTYREDQLW
jgi:hypothetical protein